MPRELRSRHKAPWAAIHSCDLTRSPEPYSPLQTGRGDGRRARLSCVFTSMIPTAAVVGILACLSPQTDTQRSVDPDGGFKHEIPSQKPGSEQSPRSNVIKERRRRVTWYIQMIQSASRQVSAQERTHDRQSGASRLVRAACYGHADVQENLQPFRKGAVTSKLK